MSTLHHEKPPALPLTRSLRQVAAVALLVVLVFAAGWVVVQVFGAVSQVLIPIIVGVLLAALLMPAMLLLNHRVHMPRHLAAGVTVVGLLALIGGTIFYAGRSIAGGISNVSDSLGKVLDKAEEWLATSPFGVDQQQLQNLLAEGRAWVTAHTSSLSSGALNATTTVGTAAVGAVLALIVTFFLLAEGDRILSWMLMVFRGPTRTKVRETIRRSWVTLGSWARTQVIVSAVDAVGIGIGAAILGLPFVVPMIVITFLLCFIPMVGATLAGIMFVLVALLFKGLVPALIMLGIVVVVVHLEGNLMQPLLMGKAVNLHPLVVLLGVATGTYLLGLTGALLTVPFMAAINVGYKYWVGRDPFPGLDAGGSALSGSPRKLAPHRKSSKLPQQVGAVTPDWIQKERVLEKSTPSEVEEESAAPQD
ncbi:AI-2E family transporter [Tessaracoccus antarcticus]|nr:AI-2E family transporter [Tessaracoccus antarcticus]